MTADQLPLPSEEPGDEFHGVYHMPDGSKGPGESGAEPDPLNATFRSKGMNQAWNEVRRNGSYGLTVKEYRDRYAIHHGVASSHLSNLHEAGYLRKLKQRRDRCGIYVLPHFVEERPTVPHVKNSPKRLHEVIVEKEVVREVTVEVPIEKEVIREVRVEIPVEVVTVVEREVPIDVTITKTEVTRVVKQWQEDKISGRVFGMDGLADGLMALIKNKMEGKE